jgi:hypothetical protein
MPNRVGATRRAFPVATDSEIAVKVDGSFNPATGQITWNFQTLDPSTLQPTIDPAAGFLPPNVHPPDGDGFVQFFVSPRATVSVRRWPSGLQLSNPQSWRDGIRRPGPRHSTDTK